MPGDMTHAMRHAPRTHNPHDIRAINSLNLDGYASGVVAPVNLLGHAGKGGGSGKGPPSVMFEDEARGPAAQVPVTDRNRVSRELTHVTFDEDRLDRLDSQTNRSRGGSTESDRSRGSATTRWSQATGVADVDSDADRSVAGDSMAPSEADDTDDPAVADARQRRYAPTAPVHGNPMRNVSYNNEPFRGNLGLFCGNWGLRGTVGQENARRGRMDRQILRCPAQLLVIAEASAELAELLKMPNDTVNGGGSGQDGLDGRRTCQHFVVRGNDKSAVLIAARTDTVTSLECLFHEIFPDHPFTKQGRRKMARSHMLGCRATFKQPIGHLGREVVVFGVHGHYRTMKFEWPRALTAFWDRLARYIVAHMPEPGGFVAGDFNMSFTEVVKQLRSRGIFCDCVAWYPWQQPVGSNTLFTSDQRLGFDSCGIFYIGGKVEVDLKWNLGHVDILAAVAGDDDEVAGQPLHKYGGVSAPGQPWTCYRSYAGNEPAETKNLRDRLVDLLTPSTPQSELDLIREREPGNHCPFLRLTEKRLNINEWLVDGVMHNGAHFPLCVFTKNASARSAEKVRERAYKRTQKKGAGKGSGKQNHGGMPFSNRPWYVNASAAAPTGNGTQNTAVAGYGTPSQSSGSGWWYDAPSRGGGTTHQAQGGGGGTFPHPSRGWSTYEPDGAL